MITQSSSNSVSLPPVFLHDGSECFFTFLCFPRFFLCPVCCACLLEPAEESEFCSLSVTAFPASPFSGIDDEDEDVDWDGADDAASAVSVSKGKSWLVALISRSSSEPPFSDVDFVLKTGKIWWEHFIFKREKPSPESSALYTAPAFPILGPRSTMPA